MQQERPEHEFLYVSNPRLKVPNLDQLVLVTNSNVEYEAQPYDAERNFKASERDAVEKKFQDGEIVDNEKKKIRWRVNEDGKVESNARIIQWSDGSYQLAIGDQIYNLETSKMNDTLLYSECKKDLVAHQSNIEEKAVLHNTNGDVEDDQFFFEE